MRSARTRGGVPLGRTEKRTSHPGSQRVPVLLGGTNPGTGSFRTTPLARTSPRALPGWAWPWRAIPVGVERGCTSRAKAINRTLATLRFAWNEPQGPMPKSDGYRGFYYHFVDVTTGRRAWKCEL